MEAQDVKIGMKVVPHDKTENCDWGLWTSPNNEADSRHFFLGNGFLIVCEIAVGYFWLGGHDGTTGSFRASDFEPYVEPEEIESREGQGDENGF